MKQVSFTDIKKIRWVLPVGLVALGFASFAASQPGTGNSKASVMTDVRTPSIEVQASASPAPTATPSITVNGTKIPTDKNGSSDINTAGGKAHVEVSNGHTRVTTSESSTSGDTSNKSTSNVNLNVTSQSSGGSNWGFTHANGYSNSFGGNTSSFSNTTVNSNGFSDVNISQ